MCLVLLSMCDEPRQSDSNLRRELAAEQHSAQNELLEDQTEERAELARSLEARRLEERRQAQARLAERTDTVRDQQDDADRQATELSALTEQACAGVDDGRRDTCPIEADRVEAVRDVDHGVAIRLDWPMSDFQPQLTCYQARAVMRRASPHAPTTCLVDMPDVEVAVGERDGQVVVELTSARSASVTELRSRSRALLSPIARN